MPMDTGGEVNYTGMDDKESDEEGGGFHYGKVMAKWCVVRGVELTGGGRGCHSEVLGAIDASVSSPDVACRFRR